MKTRTLHIRTKAAAIVATVIRYDLLAAVVVACLVIGSGVFLGHQNNGIVPLNPNPPAHYQGEPGNPLAFMANWDAPDYLTISQHGYQSLSQTNFFPLYPLLIHAVNTMVPSALDSALLIAWLGFVGAIFFYLKIVKRLYPIHDNREALRGLLLFVLFPTGVFLFAPYTEGLFGLLALGAVYYALRKRYVPAAGLSLLATAMHITGVFVLLMVGLIILEEGGKLSRAITTMAAGSLGLVTYMVFLQIRFHNALGFVTAQKGHGWLQHKTGHLVTELGAINGLIIVLLIIAAIYWWPRRKSFSVYAMLFLTIPVLGGQLGGFNRYSLMAFPIPLMLYAICRRRPLAYAIVLAGFSILWAHYLFQYAAGYVGG
jgi:hypothetical protein